MSSLTKRVLTAVLAIPVALGCLYWGGAPFFILVLAASLVAVFELRVMMVEMNMAVSGPFLCMGSAVLLTAVYLKGDVFLAPMLLVLFLLGAILELFSASARPFSRGGMLMLAILYGAFLPSHFLLLRAEPQGLALLLLVMLGTWAADTGAYFIGTKWGRHKLAPAISPNKSVEGAVGGILLAALAAQYVNNRLQIGLLPGWVLGIVIGIAAGVGDLFESALKREAGVKDAGWILPGHGGVLDRIDSLLFTVPVVYYLSKWIG
ncbi:MAG: phosphatidate cytidylyltransferase [Firmicutes bacterium]|jgi:phosphatidate cytidylyltransferase|nr:phosphatidate cytidylyltransferase [Bacillota bacterium]